ncbi:MAG: alpha/beta fold hydrolase [Saprospiraceae bacterium]|nr:alpha/beta fold hydrolase [Saprospiraceae bacterium]
MRKKAIAVASALIALFALTLHFDMYEIAIFRPQKLDQDHIFHFDTPFREVRLNAPDGATLHGVHFFHKKKSRGIIIYFHGNMGSLDRWGKIAEKLTSYDYEVLAIDYRGYGKSRGPRSEESFYVDARMWYDYAATYFGRESIVVYGRSLGTGTASWLAGNARVAGLILETPYYNFDKLVTEKAMDFPMRYFLNYHFDNAANFSRIQCPTLILHGDKDGLIPVEHARLLAAGKYIKKPTYMEIQNGNHHNLNTFDAYHNALNQFLKQQ